jgi:hypothetical protein
MILLALPLRKTSTTAAWRTVNIRGLSIGKPSPDLLAAIKLLAGTNVPPALTTAAIKEKPQKQGRDSSRESRV